jgi:GNAT superfamily N-acetyltransferase
MRTSTGMTQTLSAETLFADLELAQRVEAAWDLLGVENALVQKRLVPKYGAEVLAVGGGHAVFLGPGSPLSQAQGLGLHGSVAEADLALMEAFFRERGTTIQIEVASLADPLLLPALSRRGYLIMEQTHTLVSPRKAWVSREQPLHQSSSSGVMELVRVKADGLEHWVDVVLRCFFEEPEAPPPTLRDGAIAMAMVSGVTAWLARVDGQPAGGGSLFIHDGLALICGDGTLPNFRHRGVQTALLRARLTHALAAGCDLAVICTQPGSGSQRNAERQGFRVVYARTMMIKL